MKNNIQGESENSQNKIVYIDQEDNLHQISQSKSSTVKFMFSNQPDIDTPEEDPEG